jgi:hypothetical protein
VRVRRRVVIREENLKWIFNMSHLENLVEYLDSKLIQHVVDGDLIGIGNDLYLLVDEGVLLFDEDMYFLPNTNESVSGFIYSFGGRWYTQDIDSEELQLKELIYIGEARYKLPTNSFLGIRSGYELGNGVGNYSTYISKAKFLGATSLGICEKNTLAGVLDFQTSCLRNDIKSIIGMTISVQGKDGFNRLLQERHIFCRRPKINALQRG